MRWTETGGVRTLEHSLDGATVVFGSRRSGVSRGDFEGLNVGIGTGDDRESVAANRAALSEAAGFDPAQVVTARQIHGDEVLVHEGPPERSPWLHAEIPEMSGDGHVTSGRGFALAVITADCLPIAIKGEGGLALVHCGWRGLASGLAGKAAALVGGGSAAIGPGIGACCYRVGEEVLSRFSDHAMAIVEDRIDLAAVASEQLGREGVEEISVAGICTSCSETDFFSHRRDGERTGRQGTLAWLN